MNFRYILFLILGLDALVLLFKTSELSISYAESLVLYGDTSFLQLIIQFSIYIFGNNDFALRLPMILFHLLSILLLYSISEKYIKQEKNRIILILIFIFLPGVISSAIVVNNAGVVIFGLLFFIYTYQKYDYKYSYFLLIIFTLIDNSFSYLFFSLFLFAIYTRDYKFAVLNICLLLLSIYLFGININGSPSGHFLDTIGVYSAIFTPIIFIYMFYVLYRRMLIKNIDIIWFISSSVLMLSLLLSFRQRIYVEDFAPYLIISLPLIAQTFYSSYRVRLRIFRTNYRAVFILTLLFLFINAFVVLFNKELYRFLDNPKKHFVYNMHIAKELALELQNKDIACISTNKKMSNRLYFYGIKHCKKYQLNELTINTPLVSSVTVSYKNQIVYRANVTNINNK